MLLTKLKGSLLWCIIFAEVDELVSIIAHINLKDEQYVLLRFLILSRSHQY